MMKWSRLQLNTLPIIAIEADKAIQKLEQLITRVNTNAKFQDIQDLNNLRKSIIERIDALDRFYELHYLDSTIAIFHMIKIKLKKAIFRIDNINNETMPIQFLNIPSHINQSQNIKKSNSSLMKKQMPKTQNSLKPQIINKTPSKLNSKIKQRQKQRNKDNILKLLQTSRRQEENDTNLMQQHNFYQGNAPTFYENQQYQFYQPLFKAQKKNLPTHKVKSKQANQKLKEKVSPINKKQQNKSKLKTTQNKNEQVKKLIPKPKNNGHNHATQPSTNINQNKKSSLHTEKHEASKKLNQKSTKVLKPQNKNTKLKTQGQQIRISDPGGQNQDTGSQFRFTIKMSKQQYISLLKLKQSMKNNRKMS